MKRLTISALAALLPSLAAGSAFAQAVVGRPAPAFTLPDSSGQTHSLSDYKGKLVVLEWFNPGCPFVGKHYNSGHMQALQKEWTGKGVVWLTIDSSAPGKQGYLDAARAQALARERGLSSTALLLDPEGKVGRAYAAKTTPHMFVIDKAGAVVYAGGIDDRPSTDQADLTSAKNFVAAALGELTNGKPVTVSSSQPYGCSVKYAD